MCIWWRCGEVVKPLEHRGTSIVFLTPFSRLNQLAVYCMNVLHIYIQNKFSEAGVPNLLGALQYSVPITINISPFLQVRNAIVFHVTEYFLDNHANGKKSRAHLYTREEYTVVACII